MYFSVALCVPRPPARPGAKTTQVPQYLAQELLGAAGSSGRPPVIGVTQPRRVAAAGAAFQSSLMGASGAASVGRL